MKRIWVAVLLFAAVNAFAFPQAKTDQYKFKINQTVSVPANIGVLSNDIGGSIAQLNTQPVHGTLTTFSQNGAFTYKPKVDFVGKDQFSYILTDGIKKTAAIFVMIDVYATASGTMVAPHTVCKGDSGLVTVNLQGEPPFKVTWKDGLVQQSNTSPIVRTIKPEATVSMQITKLQDKNGPGKVAPAIVTLTPATRPPTPLVSGAAGLEIGETLRLTASTVNADYQWFRNGVALPNAVGRTLEIPSAQVGDGGIYTVTGRTNQCHSHQSLPVSVDVAPRRIVPVLGYAVGAFDSVFRTSVQIHNRADVALAGTLDFYSGHSGIHEQTLFGAKARGTEAITDVSPLLGGESIGSIDINVPSGPIVPDAVIRVYNDMGELGTTGANVPQVRMRDILRGGDSAILIGPTDPIDFRFNVGIRTFGTGVSMIVRSYKADGDLRMVVEREYPPNSFRQIAIQDLLDVPFIYNETIRFELVSGSAVIYGTTIDNRTNDPMIQMAEKVEPQQRVEQLFVPVATSLNGGFNSWFKTGVQIHNPGDKLLTLAIGFRPSLQIAGNPVKTRTYKINPFATLAIDDLLPALGTTGFGSVDITSTGFNNGVARPVVLTRIFNDGLEGETGTSQAGMTRQQVPHEGDRVILIAPTDVAKFRFNVGVRTMEEGATIDYTVRSPAGVIRAEGRREFPVEYHLQQSAADFFGIPIGANDSMEIRVVLGAVAVYGATTDNVTQDPSMQLMRR